MAAVDILSRVDPCDVEGQPSVTHRAYEPVFMELLPRGPAWSEEDDNLAALRRAFATEPSRMDRVVFVLQRETDPSRTQILLDEWEATYGLPECSTADPSDDDMRRTVLALKVKAQAGHENSYGWWLQVLEALGASLLWWENGEDVMTCIDECVDPIADDEWPFVGWVGFQYDGADLPVLECFVEHNKLGGTKLSIYQPWTKIHEDTGTIDGMAGTSSGYVIAVGSTGMVKRSTADWSVWETKTVPPGTGNIRAVAAGALDGETVITVGEPDIGTLISTDGGDTWAASKLLGTSELFGICRGPALVFVAVGDGGEIWRSTDADTWSSVASPTAVRLHAVANGDGFMLAVGASGIVLRSTTDGSSWSSVANEAGTTDLHGVDAYLDTVIAVGVGGFMQRSADGGATWEEVDSQTTADLEAVTGSHHQRWTAVGVGGVVVQSFDDGITWQVMTSPTTVDLFAVTEHWPSGHAVAGGDDWVTLRE